MASWRDAHEELDDLTREAESGNAPEYSMPHRLEELAAGQLEEPISSNHDCASALTIGLACMGVDMDVHCAGRALVKKAIASLRAV